MNKISIITVSYNSAETIRETIDSVLSQDYESIEYIVVDGNSTDGTQYIIRSYGDRIDKFISEPDSGLYDAMNKGLEMATGDVIGILNSDDLYFDSHVVSIVAQEFDKKGVDVVYGDLYYFRSGYPEKPLRHYRGGVFSLRRVRYGLMPPHPTFFIKRSLYEKYGKFDLQFRLSGDFDLILRFLGVHKAPFSYLKKVLVKMRIGGKSTSSLKRIWIMNQEDLRSCEKNGVRTNIFKFYSKYVTKIINFR